MQWRPLLTMGLFHRGLITEVPRVWPYLAMALFALMNVNTCKPNQAKQILNEGRDTLAAARPVYPASVSRH